MGTIRKRNGKFQAQVRRAGVFKSASFYKKSDAQMWMRQIETEICGGRLNAFQYKPQNIREIIERYKKEVTPTKRAAVTENIILDVLCKEAWVSIPLERVGARHFGAYKQRRLAEVKPSTFKRQFGLLIAIFRHAQREWQWTTPLQAAVQISLPKTPAGIVERITADQEAAIHDAARELKNPFMAPLIAVAITSGLRRSELLSLEFSDWDKSHMLLLVRETKNGSPRRVPLFGIGRSALEAMQASNRELMFPISANAVRLNWERLRNNAGLPHIRFHDLRHEAISRLFEKGLTVPEVASISGHKTPSQLFRYAHADLKVILSKLD